MDIENERKAGEESWHDVRIGGFRVVDPPWMGYRRSRKRGDLRVLFARSKFLRFDASIALAGDFDCQCRVAKAIEDGVRNNCVRDHFAPMVQGPL